MTHGKFGSDPTADTTADEIELRKLQRIQNFEVVKDNVFDDVDVLVFIGRAAAGVSRPDYDFEKTLDVARVYMLLRWLGDPGRGSPLLRRGGRRILPKASVKFIEELRKVGRRLRLA